MGLRVWPWVLVYEPSGAIYGATYLYVRVHDYSVERGPVAARITLKAQVLGTPETASLAVVATSKQVANVWALAGRTTLRYPAGFSTAASIARVDVVLPGVCHTVDCKLQIDTRTWREKGWHCPNNCATLDDCQRRGC